MSQIVLTRHLREEIQNDVMDTEEVIDALQHGEQIIQDPEHHDRMLTFKEIHDYRAKRERRFIIVSFAEHNGLITVITAFTGCTGHLVKREFIV